MAGLFQPQLQTQIQAERPVVDESAASAIGAVTNLAAGYFKSVAQSKPSGPTYKQAKLEQFSTTLNNLQQKSESGQVPQARILADLSIAAQQVATLDVPEALRVQFEQLSGKPFDAFSYDDPEEFQNAQLLKTDFAIGMRPSAVSALEAEGKAATPEAVDAAVLGMVEERNFLNNQFEVQRQRRAMGLPVETTPLLENLKSDYTTFLNAVKAAQGDSIVEQSEYRNLEFSVNKLIATKYAGFESNPEINGVIKQMNGLLDDIGKGVSSTPSAVLADKIQLALQSEGFNDVTIAVTRGLLEQNPEKFEMDVLKNEEGKTVADALATLLKDTSLPKPVIDIFDSNVTPTQAVVSGVNPSSFEIPTVKENPKEYQLVVENFSEAATTTDPNRLINNPRARNNWITTMNVVGNAVASQSDEYILGEKLLSVFASNGVVKNLDIIYRTDPQNAAQTNDVLQQGLVAERVRQSNELNNRLEAGVGAGQLILTTPSGELQLNNDLIGSNAASLPGGVAKWNEMRGKIEAAGGLEAFLKLPKLTFGKGANVDASIMVDGNVYFLSDLFGIEFNKVVKLSNNLKMIDTKLGDLEGLATKYSEETDRLRGKTSEIPLESITGFERIANDTAFLGAVERVSQDLGISNSDLLTAISFETVGTFNPSIKNPRSSATGLIQFIEKTAKGLGTSTAELAKMNNVEQMEYVKRYLEPYKGRMKNLGDVYMAIHWPAGVGKDDSYVMYRDGSKEYTANRNLDVSGDGTVTRGEALQRVRQMTGGGRGAPITMSELPDAPVSDTAEVSPVSVPTVDVAQTEVVAGEAVLPEKDAEAVAEAEAETKAPAVTTTPPEIEALIEALGERSLTDEEAQQFREYMSTFKVNAGG